MTARRFIGATAMAVAIAATVGASRAAAGEEPTAPGVEIVHVEQASDGQLAVLIQVTAAATGNPVDPRVTVDGRSTDASVQAVDDGDVSRTAVLALDSSDSMAGLAAAEARRAAEAFLAQTPDDVRVGLVTFSDQVEVAAEPTLDRSTVSGALADVELTSGTHVYDAVVQAAETAGEDGSRSVLVLSDGRDRGSDLDEVAAARMASDLGVRVDVVLLDDDAVAQDRLTELAEGTGGTVVRADSPEELSAAFGDAADALAHQQLVTVDLPNDHSEQADLEVAVEVDGTTYRDAATVSLDVPESAASSIITVRRPALSTPIFYAAAVAFSVTLTFLVALVLGGFRRRSAAQRRVADYLGENSTSTNDLRGSATSVVESVTRAVGEDFETRSAQRLAAAGMSLKPAEWLLAQSGVATLSAAVGWLLAGTVGLVVFLLLGGLAPMLYLRHRRSKRIRGFAELLPETLTVVAGGLSAGLSVAQAIDTVVREGREPMASELKRALVEHRLGVNLEDTLDDVAARMESDDFGWVVMAIRIQREVGGNLAEILATVAETLRERAYVARQVRALSAEGRLSAWILGGLPIAMFVYFLVANRTFVEPLYSELMGFLMLGAAGFLLSAGIWMMSRMVKVEV